MGTGSAVRRAGDPRPEAAGDLLEREREVARLREAVEAAGRGEGSATVVCGAAGTGKSRLLAAAAEHAGEAGLRVLAGCGRELERRVTLGAAVDLLARPVAAAGADERRRLLGGPAAPAAGLFTPAHREPSHGAVAYPAAGAILLGLCWLVAHLTGWDMPGAALRPTLLLMDDAQWADTATQSFLAMLADRLDQLPLALVIAVRDDEAWTGTTTLRRLAARPRGRLLTPAPLTEEAVGRLVAAAFPAADRAFADAVAHASGGNPFLVSELLRSLYGAGAAPVAGAVPDLVPDAVLHSVLARLARLPGDAARLAASVAVLGDGTPLRRAAAHAGLEVEPAERAADALAGAQLFRPGSPLSFVHPLVGAAVYADQPAFARSRAHLRAVDLLTADGEGAAKAAGHLLATEPEGDPGVAAGLREAADRALRLGDPGAAARLLARAAAEPPPAELRAEVLLELARAQTLAGDLAAEATLTEALGLLAAGDAGGRVRALTLLASVRHGRGDQAGAAAACEEALGLFEPHDPRRQDDLAECLAIAIFHPGLRRTVEERLRPLLEGAGHAGPALLAHIVLWRALAGDPPALVRSAAERALTAPAAGSPLNPAGQGALLGLTLHGLVIAGELTAAEDAASAAMAAARRRGDILAYGYASYHRALSRLGQGSLPEALADMEAAQVPYAAGWTTGGGWNGWLLARVLLEHGDRAAAAEALRMADLHSADSMEAGLVRHVRAQLALAEGRPDVALEEARAAGRHLGQVYGIDHPGLLPWRTTAALAADLLGDHGQAARLAARALQRAREVGVTRDIGIALRVSGLVARPVPDVALLAEAAATLQRIPAALEQARALVDLGAALRRTGDRDACTRPLKEGLALADRLHARPLAERARAELHAIGLRPRRAAVTGIDALTAAERRVALLALHGHTNRQIAQDLFITTKTVETHLARVYRKLAIANRRQLHTAFHRGCLS
ncbi:ATP-binding protein [Actinomadura bangladeshensis]|nr:AAA family ATPase [Actinomadura bangladeshensis]